MSERLELAGNFMTFVEDDEGTAHITFDDVGTGRRCGDCRLCCRLLPVPLLRKAAGERCRYSRHGKGCTIYEQRPDVCRTWSCRWLADPTTTAIPRPDRAHYVIDLEYDYVTMQDAEGSRIQVMQVWVDPAFRSAWDTKPLRDYMLLIATKWATATIIRFSSRDALVVFPPPLSSDGQWHIVRGGKVEARNAYEQEILERDNAFRIRCTGVELAPPSRG
jgi:hypothetical protein